MNHETLKDMLTDPANDGLWLREKLMPRWMDGSSSRPMTPPPGAPAPRIGAVLLLLYPYNNALYLPLTVRTVALTNHSGEVSLPGGRYDEPDGSLRQTALREAWEELGIQPETVTVWTELTSIWIPVSNFQITPFVAWTHERPQFAPSANEVAELIEVPLDLLLQPETIQSELRRLRGVEMYIPYFAVDQHKVWGATSLVLAEVVGKLTREPLRDEHNFVK